MGEKMSDIFEKRTPHRLPPRKDLVTQTTMIVSTPTTTTAKDNACCLSWDLHEAAATQGGAEAVRRFCVAGGDPGRDQWGNSALHVGAEHVKYLLPHSFATSMPLLVRVNFFKGFLSTLAAVLSNAYTTERQAREIPGVTKWYHT